MIGSTRYAAHLTSTGEWEEEVKNVSRVRWTIAKFYSVDLDHSRRKRLIASWFCRLSIGFPARLSPTLSCGCFSSFICRSQLFVWIWGWCVGVPSPVFSEAYWAWSRPADQHGRLLTVISRLLYCALSGTLPCPLICCQIFINVNKSGLPNNVTVCCEGLRNEGRQSEGKTEVGPYILLPYPWTGTE